MKDDKFLIAIVAGIVVLVIVALVTVLLRTPNNEEYIADNTPEGVVHNYFLALQRQDYEKAYSYLADDLQAKPTLDEFTRELDYTSSSEVTLQIYETRLGDVHTQVDISITTYSSGGIFDSGSYNTEDTVYLRATGDGGEWRLIEFPYPYWGYSWDQDQN